MRPSLHSGHGEEEVRDNEVNTATLKSVSVQGTLERQQAETRVGTFTEGSEDAFVFNNT